MGAAQSARAFGKDTSISVLSCVASQIEDKYSGNFQITEGSMSSLLRAQEKVDELAKKLSQAKALEQAIRARDRSKTNKAERAADTRRKVLVGAFVMAQTGGKVSGMTLQGAKFTDYLTRDSDRALFGLAPSAPDGADQPGEASDLHSKAPHLGNSD
ncbi:hypothetical protein D3C87_1637130 [compost metagenome]